VVASKKIPGCVILRKPKEEGGRAEGKKGNMRLKEAIWQLKTEKNKERR